MKRLKCLWIVFVPFLAGCGWSSLSQEFQFVNNSAATTPSIFVTPPFPVGPFYPTFPAQPTPRDVLIKPTPTKYPSVSPRFPMEGYVMLFKKEGELYFQDENAAPVRLTRVDKTSLFMLSDDRGKVIFNRDDGYIYSINIDGSGEQRLLLDPSDEPFKPVRGADPGTSMFVPHTHLLLTEDIECASRKYVALCSVSLILIDADTGHVEVLGNFDPAFQMVLRNRTVRISPDGTVIAVATDKGVTLLTLDGTVIRPDILPYKPTSKGLLLPSLFWLPDSSGLIVAIPDTVYNSHAWSDLPAYTIWRYTIEDDKSVQIPFDPAPMNDSLDVSPDGKWIVYGGILYDLAVYVGNLEDGATRVVGEDQPLYRFSWGPDGSYFITSVPGSLLGTRTSKALQPTCAFIDWVDPRHFTCLWGATYLMAEIGSRGGASFYDLGLGTDLGAFPVFKIK